MKKILLIRHAKSSWDSGFRDTERPLNHRGKKDAPLMAARLLKKEVKIDAFVSSPAARAFETAVFFANAYQRDSKEIITLSQLYEVEAKVFYNVISELIGDLETVAIFSHNPGITDFVNTLTSAKIDDMPTCAVFAIKAGIKQWSDFKEKDKEFWFFEYPKNQ